MIPISQAARAKLYSRSLNDRIEVVITPPNSAPVLTFTDEDIVPSSVSITKINSDGNQIAIGTSMQQQFSVQLRHDFADANLKGSMIESKYYVILGTNSEELVAHHKFFIDEIEQTTPKIASITAYCNLDKLSRPIGSKVFTGTPFQILNAVNNALGEKVIDVPSDGSTPSEFSTLPNVISTLQLSQAENNCETYRDIVNTVCQMIGVFIQGEPATTMGKVCTYHLSVDTTINLGNRKDFSHNRYPTSFDSLSVSGMKGQFSSPVITTPSMTNYDLGDSAAWDFGTASGLQARTDALFTFISQYEYTSGQITMWSEPTIECGDRVKVIAEDGEYEMLVTEVTWAYNGNTLIRCAGEDKANRTSTTKGTSRKTAVSNSANRIVMYSVTNETAISLGSTDNPSRLCRIAFSTIGNTEVLWFGEALLNAIANSISVPVTVTPVDSQGNPVTVLDSNGHAVVWTANTTHKGDVKIQVMYKLDGGDIEYSPKDEYLSGDHILSMFYSSVVTEQSAHIWEVWIKVLKGSIEIAQQSFRGTLMGQNLVATDSWGGLLTFIDTINAYITEMDMGTITEGTVGITDYSPITDSLTETIAPISEVAVVQNLTESVTITIKYGDHINFCGEGYYCGTDGVLL